MFERGEIVYHDEIVFDDKVVDKKKMRPCIVLFEFNYNGENLVCTCPITSNVSKFNKYPNEYLLIPEVIYRYKKISFAKINNILFHKESETHRTNIMISSSVPNKIINILKNSKSKKYEIAQFYLEKIELPENTKKKQKKK